MSRYSRIPSLGHRVVLGVDHHAIVDGGGAGRNDHRASRTFQLDEAHATHADGPHAGMPAEAGDIYTVLLGDPDQQVALRSIHLDPIHGDRDGLGDLLFGGHASGQPP